MSPAEKRAVERVGEEIVAQDMRVLGSEVAVLLITHERAALELAARVVESRAIVEECADDTMAGMMRGRPWRLLAAEIRALGGGATTCCGPYDDRPHGERLPPMGPDE